MVTAAHNLLIVLSLLLVHLKSLWMELGKYLPYWKIHPRKVLFTDDIYSLHIETWLVKFQCDVNVSSLFFFCLSLSLVFYLTWFLPSPLPIRLFFSLSSGNMGWSYSGGYAGVYIHMLLLLKSCALLAFLLMFLLWW